MPILSVIIPCYNNGNLLKEMIDKSSGIDSLFCRHTRSRETARISSLTTIAVGGSDCNNNAEISSVLFCDTFATSTQYSGRIGSPCFVSASW